jgi:hypothetical protein
MLGAMPHGSFPADCTTGNIPGIWLNLCKKKNFHTEQDGSPSKDKRIVGDFPGDPWVFH